jgi:hypothetical protein
LGTFDYCLAAKVIARSDVSQPRATAPNECGARENQPTVPRRP